MSNHREIMSHSRKTAFSDAVLRAFSGGQFTLPPSLESAFAALALGDSDPPPHKPTTLLDLPAELKLEIFDYLLRPGDVYIRWNARAAHHDIRFAHILEGWDSTPAPWLPTLGARPPQPPHSPTHCETQLFLVSKQLRDEAMHYYLTQNTFHIMGRDSALPYLS
jgi:hypothetical protein